MKDTINWEGALYKLTNKGEALMRVAAEFFAERIRHYAPVDTGRLQASVQIYESAFHSWSVTVLAPYAVFVEFGHWDGLHNRGYVPAHPYVRPALADTIAEFPRLASVMSTNEFGSVGETSVGSRAWTSVPDAGGFQSNFKGETTFPREFYAGKMQEGPNIGVTF